MRDDASDLDRLYPLVYDELRRMAVRLRPSHSLGPTTLVHEAYERLAQLDQSDWTPLRLRVVASAAMRSVLVDRARRRGALKRGGERVRVTISNLGTEPDIDIFALHQALTQLEDEDETAYRIVEMRFFGGLTNEEVAEALDTSLRTVERRWRAARALLRHLLHDDTTP